MINDELEYGGTYTSIEELKKAEKRDKGSINWEVWDKLVTKLREELKDIPMMIHKKYKTQQPVYAYTIDYKFIGKYNSIVEASKALNVNYQTMHRYVNEGLILKKKGLRLLTENVGGVT